MRNESLRARVRDLLNKNPLLTPKQICKILALNYRRHGDYIGHIKTAWKYDYANERGLKCSIHAWRGYSEISRKVFQQIRPALLKLRDWRLTRAKNRWFLFKHKIGRIQLFETGRVNIWVRKPATKGRVMQLLSNGFVWTDLITRKEDLKRLFDVHFKGAHYVFDLGGRLPKFSVDMFNRTNGFIAKLGDRSHPTSFELMVHYPDWAERSEKVLIHLTELLDRAFNPVEDFKSRKRSKFYTI